MDSRITVIKNEQGDIIEYRIGFLSFTTQQEAESYLRELDNNIKPNPYPTLGR